MSHSSMIVLENGRLYVRLGSEPVEVGYAIKKGIVYNNDIYSADMGSDLAQAVVGNTYALSDCKPTVSEPMPDCLVLDYGFVVITHFYMGFDSWTVRVATKDLNFIGPPHEAKEIATKIGHEYLAAREALVKVDDNDVYATGLNGFVKVGFVKDNSIVIKGALEDYESLEECEPYAIEAASVLFGCSPNVRKREHMIVLTYNYPKVHGLSVLWNIATDEAVLLKDNKQVSGKVKPTSVKNFINGLLQGRKEKNNL